MLKTDYFECDYPEGCCCKFPNGNRKCDFKCECVPTFDKCVENKDKCKLCKWDCEKGEEK